MFIYELHKQCITAITMMVELLILEVLVLVLAAVVMVVTSKYGSTVHGCDRQFDGLKQQ